ncbi:hypothetical protein PD374_20500 [Pseudomonas sp. WCS374]|nr:hypothetical protein PD374_20500 [Pseudomonas sp. WCS374]
MLGLLPALGIDVQQAGHLQLAAEGFYAQLVVPGLGEKHRVERLQLAKTAGSTCRVDQQTEVGRVQLKFTRSRHVAIDVAIRHAPGLRGLAVVGDIQGAALHVDLQITQVHVKVLAANT